MFKPGYRLFSSFQCYIKNAFIGLTKGVAVDQTIYSHAIFFSRGNYSALPYISYKDKLLAGPSREFFSSKILS